MKYTNQDNKICAFYVTDRLLDILELEDTNQIKLLKLLNEFKDEMIHNLGVNSLHNHYGELSNLSGEWKNLKERQLKKDQNKIEQINLIKEAEKIARGK